ncbi:MAG: hypothetical protein V4691_07560, partial [Pseudomonadota bacterium]
MADLGFDTIAESNANNLITSFKQRALALEFIAAFAGLDPEEVVETKKVQDANGNWLNFAGIRLDKFDTTAKESLANNSIDADALIRFAGKNDTYLSSGDFARFFGPKGVNAKTFENFIKTGRRTLPDVPRVQ